jgi:hypothetical protein
MDRLPFFILALLSLGHTICGSSTAKLILSRSQIPLSTNDITIRPAVEADVDDIVTVIIEAFLPGPAWQYIYTHAEQYKDLFWHCLRQELGGSFARLPNNAFLNVITKPHHNFAHQTDSNGKVDHVVAIAGWKLISSESSDPDQTDLASIGGVYASFTKCSSHPEMNLTRAVDFQQQANDIDMRYVYGRPGDQFYLALLATHPSWDGHGFGAAHLHWGLEKARTWGKHVPVTLVSTPAGWSLYDSLGFKSVQNITVTTLDDDIDDLWFEYMDFEGTGDKP